jgi:hypothetical protein
MKHLLPALALATGMAAAACGVTTPSDNRTETITAALTPGTSHTHTYTFSKRGESMLTITSIVPTINGSIYVSIGLVANGACSLFTTSVQPVVLNREIAFGTLDAGTYCLQFIDPGVLVTSTTYSGTFSYP